MGSFVAANSRSLTLHGSPRPFSGTNCYYLPYSSRSEVDRLLDHAAQLGLSVIRTWAFLDEEKNGVRFQSWDTAANGCCVHHGPDGLERLDYLISAAAARNLKLLLPLVNNWHDFGGVQCYCNWLGLADHGEFYESPAARAAYREWCRQLLTRINSVSGIAYRDEPAILGWELVNEARCSLGIPTLTRWFAEMSEYVKTLAPRHLVGLGDEGLMNHLLARDWLYNGSCGYDFEAFLELPAVDFAAFHLYPETWGHASSADDAREFGRRWILDHAEAGGKAGKPVLLEEYGIKNPEWRDEIYADWLEVSRGAGIAADLFWMLAAPMDSGQNYPDYDGFTLYADSMPSSVRYHLNRLDHA